MEENDFFTITTNREVANQLHNYAMIAITQQERSFIIGDIKHHASVLGGDGYSTIQIFAKPGGIKPTDLFWLGHHSAGMQKFIDTTVKRACTEPKELQDAKWLEMFRLTENGPILTKTALTRRNGKQIGCRMPNGSVEYYPVLQEILPVEPTPVRP